MSLPAPHFPLPVAVFLSPLLYIAYVSRILVVTSGHFAVVTPSLIR